MSSIARQIIGEKAVPRQVIALEVTEEAAESLIPLLQELQRMGRRGSSRSIRIEDWE